ncbi:MAG: YkgJ family cysteine cluster protein [Candidatus Lokiarchaeota archaeon]|nr:YkgJ family cysteine cluster protein [Candidatus Lokiarchaeota archaeon]
MTDLVYKCKLCGTCCHEVPGDYVKRIPIYPDEADKMIEIAKERGVDFKIIEDLVFPDVINENILVLTYRIRLDNETQGCPFYDKSEGCTIQDVKPLACQAYPLALKRQDAFNFEISIDPLCNFVIENYDKLENVDIDKLREIFKEEYPKAETFYRKNKKLMFKIRKLEVTNQIKIPHQISIEEFNKYLQQWDRKEITVK